MQYLGSKGVAHVIHTHPCSRSQTVYEMALSLIILSTILSSSFAETSSLLKKPVRMGRCIIRISTDVYLGRSIENVIEKIKVSER